MKDNEIIQQLHTLPTVALSDAMDGENHANGAIKPLYKNASIAGRIQTVKIEEGQNRGVLQAIASVKKDDVLVVSTGEWTSHAIAGDFVLKMARELGIGGIITDGVIRDEEEIVNMAYPVFSQGSSPAAGKKEKLGKINEVVILDGITFRPGDFVKADCDGIIVIAHPEAPTIIDKAKVKLDKDEQREQKVLQGEDHIREYLESVR